MPRTVMILVSTLTALVLAGCSGTASDDGGSDVAREPSASPSTTSSDPAAPESAPAEGDGSTGEAGAGEVPQSLDFTGTTVTGDDFEGASLQGRPTLLWFWAPWCPTCRGQIPQVQGLADDYEGELNVVGVGSLDSAEAIADFAGDVPGITHLEDVDGELWQRFGVTEQSSFVLLDEDGAVAFEAGYGGTDDLDARVEDVLG